MYKSNIQLIVNKGLGHGHGTTMPEQQPEAIAID
jgi:hypothetical protein